MKKKKQPESRNVWLANDSTGPKHRQCVNSVFQCCENWYLQRTQWNGADIYHKQKSI